MIEAFEAFGAFCVEAFGALCGLITLSVIVYMATRLVSLAITKSIYQAKKGGLQNEEQEEISKGKPQSKTVQRRRSEKTDQDQPTEV